ncbi:hypothetical protein THASP1DRAFT_22575 [Thamnocephalis sphaerospora]|uniref:Uncharacterized protein n=1 Tax=Thamnocephalis sphaerospora TaxID=78915 RepID=A0A4P9XTV6_9FUNG|nr:hypothetical protein THASP1DRAFT_22575 [Thamnocephalis sphaerospora]|eukprot:RKP09596.1 hypothetical protein THASP1DRAFT_22575 [Thamnocephalis sphaerospora]
MSTAPSPPPQGRRRIRRLLSSFLGRKRSHEERLMMEQPLDSLYRSTAAGCPPGSGRPLSDSNIFDQDGEKDAMPGDAIQMVNYHRVEAARLFGQSDRQNGGAGDRAGSEASMLVRRATSKLTRKGSRLLGKRHESAHDAAQRRWSKGAGSIDAGRDRPSQEKMRLSMDMRVLRRNADAPSPMSRMAARSDDTSGGRARSVTVTSANSASGVQHHRTIWRRGSLADTLCSRSTAAGSVEFGGDDEDGYGENSIMEAVTRGDLPVPPELTSPMAPPRSLLLTARRSREKAMLAAAQTASPPTAGPPVSTLRGGKSRHMRSSSESPSTASPQLQQRALPSPMLLSAATETDNTGALATPRSLFLDVPTNNQSCCSLASVSSDDSQRYPAPPSPAGTFGQPGGRWGRGKRSVGDVSGGSGNASAGSIACYRDKSAHGTLESLRRASADNSRRASISSVCGISALDRLVGKSTSASQPTSGSWSPHRSALPINLASLGAQLAMRPLEEGRRPHSVAILPSHRMAGRSALPRINRRRAVISWHA